MLCRSGLCVRRFPANGLAHEGRDAGYMVSIRIHTTRADRTHVRTAGGGSPVWRRALTTRRPLILRADHTLCELLEARAVGDGRHLSPPESQMRGVGATARKILFLPSFFVSGKLPTSMIAELDETSNSGSDLAHADRTSCVLLERSVHCARRQESISARSNLKQPPASP